MWVAFKTQNWTKHKGDTKVQRQCRSMKLCFTLWTCLFLAAWVTSRSIIYFFSFWVRNKSSVTWLFNRDRVGLGRVLSPSRRGTAGWHRAPAVRGVQGKYIRSTHHTHPSLCHPTFSLSPCQIQILSRGRLAAVLETRSRLRRSHEKLMCFCIVL